MPARTTQHTFAAVLSLFVTGCAEVVHFRSVPAGAKVYVNEAYVGDTPTTFSTRDVVDRPYRVEKDGYEQEGTLRARLAPGRLVGAIFTLGIVAATRPLFYYIPNPVDVSLGPVAYTPPSPHAAVKLYNLKTSEIADGSCDSKGNCTVAFPSGRKCSGTSVRETQGVARAQQGATAVEGYGAGWGYGAASAGAASDKQIATSQRGVAMLRCGDVLIDCSLTLDAFGPTGHGDCTDPKGGKYRLMLLPP